MFTFLKKVAGVIHNVHRHEIATNISLYKFPPVSIGWRNRKIGSTSRFDFSLCTFFLILLLGQEMVELKMHNDVITLTKIPCVLKTGSRNALQTVVHVSADNTS